jgi:hypothetical protein
MIGTIVQPQFQRERASAPNEREKEREEKGLGHVRGLGGKLRRRERNIQLKTVL